MHVLSASMLAVVFAWVFFPRPATAQDASSTIFDMTSDRVDRRPDVRDLFTLKRVVRHFSFEESTVRPLDLPIGFYRYIQSDLGFPEFGEMSPVNDEVFGGEYAFGFHLDGGSMSARVPTSVIPVMPTADYVVSTMVRTEGLTHSAVGLAAWLYDENGDIIPGSRVQSPLIRTNGRWEQLQVRILGRFPDAVDLGLELMLLQSGQSGSALNSSRRSRNVQLDDVDGKAWFDDVLVVHAPSIDISTPNGSSLIPEDEPLELRVRVRDMTGERMLATLVITDIDGRVVGQREITLEDGPRAHRLSFDSIASTGWYRASLVLQQDDIIVARRQVDLVRLPEMRRASSQLGLRFGVRVPDDQMLLHPSFLPMARELGTMAAELPIWTEGVTLQMLQDRFPTYIKHTEGLLGDDAEISFRLWSVPTDLADTLGLDLGQVHQAFASANSEWRPYLDPILINFGLEVQHWHLGSGITVGDAMSNDLRLRIDQTTRAFGQFVPSPTIMTDWPMAAEPDSSSPLPGYQLTLSPAARATSTDDMLRPWPRESPDVQVEIETLSESEFTARERVIDLAIRTLHLWRGGGSIVSIEAPWRIVRQESGDTVAMPSPMYPAWRTLRDQLAGRTYAGSLDLGPGVHCWILMGRTAEDSALVLWSDSAMTTEIPGLDMVLGRGPARVINMSGHATLHPTTDGIHSIPAGKTPVFIDQVDIPLSLFRAAFRLDPGTFEAEHRKHEHMMVLTNPWDVAISGVIDLEDNADWTVRPRSSRFNIAPGETQLLPVELVFDRSISAGTKYLRARTRMRAKEEYELTLSTSFEIAHPDLEMIGQWRVEQNPETGVADLVVVQYTMNRGTEKLGLQSTFSAPGRSQQRTSLGILDPGATAIKSYRIPNGVALLSGRDIRLGVLERNGPKRMHRILTIPDFYGTGSQAVLEEATAAAEGDG